ncbi:MAG TPA: hypothetical protein VH877_13200 [Polyangia bacterium]|nr:hypothetical protein [Polyangia bacterium]
MTLVAPHRAGLPRPALFVLLTAAMTIAIGALMAVQGARSQTIPTDQLQSFILRFELARSESEVSHLLGAFDSPAGQRLRAALNLINTTDFAFALAYPSFTIAALAFLADRRTKRMLTIATLLALVMTSGDWIENRALIALASEPTPAHEHIERLRVATTAKWSAIFLSTGMMGAALLTGRSWWRRGLSLLAFAGAALGLYSVLVPTTEGFDPRQLAGPANSALTVLWLVILGMAAWQVATGLRGGTARPLDEDR